jgi:hypothetical protein
MGGGCSSCQVRLELVSLPTVTTGDAATNAARPRPERRQQQRQLRRRQPVTFTDVGVGRRASERTSKQTNKQHSAPHAERPVYTCLCARPTQAKARSSGSAASLAARALPGRLQLAALLASDVRAHTRLEAPASAPRLQERTQRLAACRCRRTLTHTPMRAMYACMAVSAAARAMRGHTWALHSGGPPPPPVLAVRVCTHVCRWPCEQTHTACAAAAAPKSIRSVTPRSHTHTRTCLI